MEVVKMNGTNETIRDYLARQKAESLHKSNKVQSSWSFKTLNTSQLKSKMPYQRAIDTAFIANAVRNFNPDDVEPIHVSYRDGKYYVIDGQHTIIILEEVNGGSVNVECIVHKGMTPTDEAEYSIRQYEKKHNHTYAQKSVAAYEAGRELPCEIARKVSAVGARLPYDRKTTTGMKIQAIKRVTNFYQKDSKNTILAIKCLVEAYSTRESSLPADLIGGTMEFLRQYEDSVEISRLVEALSKTTPQALTITAKNLKLSYPVNWTETLRNNYNNISRKGKIKFKDNV